METRVFAVRIKKRETLSYSSSGGAFPALTEAFILNGNAVLCSSYNYESNKPEFRTVHSLEDRDKSRGSIYVQSSTGETWKEAKEWLRDNPEKQLMFFGTGCQCAGFIRYAEIEKFRDRITVIDIICHGTPSPLIWKEYIENLIGDRRMTHVNFRDKRTGWDHSVGIATIDGEDVSIRKYRRIYSDRYTLRPSCTKCPYTKVERDTDMTIGDFWHMNKSMPDFFDPMGTSLLIIHTERGMELFDSISDSIEFRESNVRDCLQHNLVRPTEHSEKREKFWKDYREKGIEYVMDKYGTLSIFERGKRKIGKMLRKNEF